MQALSRPTAAGSCRAISSRRPVTSTAAVNSSSRRRSVQRAQHRNLHHYRLAAIPDEQDAGRQSDDTSRSTPSRMDRWEDKLDDLGINETTGFSPAHAGEHGPSDVAVFDEGTGPAASRVHSEHTRIEDKAEASSSSSTMATSSSATIGRDMSDMLNESAGASNSSSSGTSGRGEALTGSGVGVGYDAESARVAAEGSEPPNPRAHPVARTAGAAAASAAGTILGAVAGPVGAAAGAAVGAALGRRAADLLAGSEEQGEVYDAGAEPEQVAEEMLSAGAVVTDKARDAADRARDAAGTAQHKASELVDRAGERLQRDTGGSSAQTAAYTDMGAVKTFDTGMEGPAPTLSQAFGSDDLVFDTKSSRGRVAVDPESGRGVEGSKPAADHDHGQDSSRSKVADIAKSAADRVAGAAESLKESAVDAAHTAADKIQDAADKVPFPEFPPAADADDFNAAGGGVRLEDDQALQAARERVSGAADSARDRLGSAAAEVKDRARSAAAAASERLSGAGDRAADAAASTARTAADYGAPDTSERLQEMSNKGAATTSGGASSPVRDTPESEWGTSRDLGAMPSAEAIVKADVGSPMRGGSSLMQQDNMPLAD